LSLRLLALLNWLSLIDFIDISDYLKISISYTVISEDEEHFLDGESSNLLLIKDYYSASEDTFFLISLSKDF